MSISNKTSILTSGSLMKPGAIGRTLRFLMGVFLLGYVYFVVTNYSFFANSTPTMESLLGWTLYFVGVAYAFMLLPYIVNLGFSGSWGKPLQRAVLVLAFAAIVFNLVRYGNVWGPPLAYLALALGLYWYAHLGVSFVLSAVIATPGCEMRAIPHLATMLFKRDVTEAAVCPSGL